MAAFYIIVLQAVLAYTVPAVRSAGLSALVAFTAYLGINVTAMVARVVWGKVADRQEGRRRARTLVEVGLVAAAGALVFTVALHAGPVAVVAAAVIFGFGALGWNGIVYVSAGELATPELAGRSVAVAATVVFLLSALCTPLLGAVAARAGWDAFWVSTGLLALAGALIAVRLPTPVPTERLISGRGLHFVCSLGAEDPSGRRAARTKRRCRRHGGDSRGDHRRQARAGRALEGGGARARARAQPDAHPRGPRGPPGRGVGGHGSEPRSDRSRARRGGSRRPLQAARAARGVRGGPRGDEDAAGAGGGAVRELRALRGARRR